MLNSKEDVQIMKLAIRIEQRKQAMKFCGLLIVMIITLAGVTSVIVDRKESKIAAIQEQIETQEDLNTLTDSVISAQKRIIEQQTEIATRLVEHNNVYIEPIVPKLHKSVTKKSTVRNHRKVIHKISSPKIVKDPSESILMQPEITPLGKCNPGSTKLDDKTCYNAVNDQFYKAK